MSQLGEVLRERHEEAINQANAGVAKDRATHGYKRVWARLRIDGHRVYRVTRVGPRTD